MIAAWALAGVLALDVCDACRVADTKVILCAPHASAEKTALTWCGKGLRAKDEKERIAALEKLARETDAHTNAPSPRIVDMLVRGTRDDSYAVRTRAVELLGPPQHGPAALEALIEVLREHDEEMSKWLKERGKLDQDPLDRNRPIGEQLEKMKAQTAELVAMNARYQLMRAWGGTIAVQLGHFPDDAAVTAILASSWARAAPGAQRSLLTLGSAAAVRGAVEHLGGVQAAYARRPDARRDVEEEQQALRALHDDLAAFASARSLPAPAWDPAPAEAWERWLAEHAGGFPEHLPGVRSPAW